MNRRTDDSAAKIRRRAERLQHARDHPANSPLRGFGTFGMIGWTVATPTVAGALLGLWLEERVPRSFSWPIALILGGMALGSFMAWGWIARERQDEQGPDEPNDELD